MNYMIKAIFNSRYILNYNNKYDPKLNNFLMFNSSMN